jgi:hypothetical protein
MEFINLAIKTQVASCNLAQIHVMLRTETCSKWRRQDGEAVHFKIKKDAPLATLMAAFCARRVRTNRVCATGMENWLAPSV